MPLFEIAAKEKEYSVFGRRPSTTKDEAGPNDFVTYLLGKSK